MANSKRVNIADVRRDLALPDVEKRGHAIHMLLMAMHRQPELQAPAREIFRHAVEHETYEWIVTTALTGLERLDGPDGSRAFWRRLLMQADAAMAGRVAMAMHHPSHAPMLLELIDQRTDYLFRRGAIYALGRMHDSAALPTLLRLGQQPELTPAVVQALGEMGDSAALAWLTPLVHDNTHLPELDERGATWTLGDIAAQAVRSIEHKSGRQATVDQPPPGTPPPLPRPPGTQHDWPQQTAPAFIPATAFTSRRPWSFLHPSLIPLAAAGLELGWLFILFASYIFMVGDQKPTFTVSDRFVDAIALPLPAIGLIAAITVLLGGLAPRGRQKAVVLTGGLICGYFVFVFGLDFVTR